MMGLQNKKILITAGPTWIGIDKVRVISNISTGETGFYIAKEAAKYGADVTLVLGPTPNYFFDKKIKFIHFKFFEELKEILREKLTSEKFDILIHSAAVSDYRPKKRFSRKIRGDLKRFNLILEPTEKLVDRIKRYDPKIFLVVFKLECRVNKDTLIKRTYKLLNRTNADLAVGNIFDTKTYRAFILDKKDILASVKTKEGLAKKLMEEISKRV
jgi:phosphopantothenoylcysteine decarboxylase/phosphopantothenate--cysteine ligase